LNLLNLLEEKYSLIGAYFLPQRYLSNFSADGDVSHDGSLT
jgi:hypothetical protein